MSLLKFIKRIEWQSGVGGGRVLWAVQGLLVVHCCPMLSIVVQGLLVGTLALLSGISLKREAAIHSLNRSASTHNPNTSTVDTGRLVNWGGSWCPWQRRRELWNKRSSLEIYSRVLSFVFDFLSLCILTKYFFSSARTGETWSECWRTTRGEELPWSCWTFDFRCTMSPILRQGENIGHWDCMEGAR